MRPVQTPEILLKTEKMTLVLEGLGDGKVRATASAWPEAKVMLDGEALQVQAVTGKQFYVTRQKGVKKMAPVGGPRKHWAAGGLHLAD
jgi:hypothetical protein